MFLKKEPYQIGFTLKQLHLEHEQFIILTNFAPISFLKNFIAIASVIGLKKSNFWRVPDSQSPKQTA